MVLQLAGLRREPWRLRLGILMPRVLGPCVPAAAGMGFRGFVRVKHFWASQAFCTGSGVGWLSMVEMIHGLRPCLRALELQGYWEHLDLSSWEQSCPRLRSLCIFSYADWRPRSGARVEHHKEGLAEGC